MAGLSRRGFLTRSLALGCTAAASPFLTPITLAATPGDARLVVIILRGAMDGLDVLRPVGDPHLAALRPRLARMDGALALDNFHTLHPELSGLQPMWQAGELGFLTATSTPYRDKRSHFDGQDLLEAGTGAEVPGGREGWLNRALSLMPGATSRTAFAVGRDTTLILDGPAAATRWSPGVALDLSPQAQLLLARVYADDPLFEDAARDALHLAGGNAPRLRPGQATGPDTLAGFVAQQLRAETRIAAFSIGGWDTHRNQHTALNGALGHLQLALTTLQRDLGPVWRDTAVLALTEFGRTVRENGSGGTDHGTGSAALFAGGALRGGQVYGDWPGLAEGQLYAGRDLMPTRDVRAYAGWVLHSQFGLARSAIEGAVFPGLDMGARPGFLG